MKTQLFSSLYDFVNANIPLLLLLAEVNHWQLSFDDTSVWINLD